MPVHNAERGEVPLTIGGVEIVIAATMQGLAAVSSRCGCKSFQDLYALLYNVEVNAVLAGVEAMAVRGDVQAALKALTLRDFPAVRIAFIAALTHHVGLASGGKTPAAKGRNRRPRGGSGSNSPSAPSDGLPPNSGLQP